MKQRMKKVVLIVIAFTMLISSSVSFAAPEGEIKEAKLDRKLQKIGVLEEILSEMLYAQKLDLYNGDAIEYLGTEKVTMQETKEGIQPYGAIPITC